MFESRISAGATENLSGCEKSCEEQSCVARHRELANSKVEQLCKVSKPCLHDHQFRKEQVETVGKVSKICSRIVLKYKLARAGTTWTRACDKRSARLISYIHHTCEFQQYCQVGKTAQHCRLGLFQDSDFAGDREDSKSTSEGVLCYFWKSNICSHKLDV